jgi:carbon storage regulator
MLILTRRIGERVRIGDHITVVITDAWAPTRWGIDAPRGVPVRRKEVYDPVKQGEGLRPRLPETYCARRDEGEAMNLSKRPPHEQAAANN